MTDVAAAIAALPGSDAVRVLADVADFQGPLPDPAELRALDTALREAVAADEGLAASYARPAEQPDAGQLARLTLEYLAAAQPGLDEVIARAISMPAAATRFDPVTLSAGALVLVLLQTEVKLTRNAQGKWTLTVHKHAARDSTLGRLLGQLFSLSPPGGG